MGSFEQSIDWQFLVDLIYTEHFHDTETLMREVLDRFRRVSKFSSAAFLPVDAATGALRTGVSMDHDAQCSVEYLERYLSLDPYMINGPAPDTMNKVFVFSDVAAGVPGFRQSEFRSFMQSVPYADALAALLATPASPVGVVTVHRTSRMAKFSARDIRDFGWLTRHLAKGLDSRERASNLEPKPGLGRLAVDIEGNILWLNGLARKILDEAHIDPRALCRLPPSGGQYKTRGEAFHARHEPLGRNSVYVRRGWIDAGRSLQEAPLHVPRKPPTKQQLPALMITFAPVSTAAGSTGWMASAHLTSTERKVARLLLQGRNYRSIAEFLDVEETTIKTHAYNIYAKAGVRTRHELMAMLVAREQGDESIEAV